MLHFNTFSFVLALISAQQCVHLIVFCSFTIYLLKKILCLLYWLSYKMSTSKMCDTCRTSPYCPFTLSLTLPFEFGTVSLVKR